MTRDEIMTLPMSTIRERLPKLQFYMVFMRTIDPAQDVPAMMASSGREHLAYLHDLEERGLLFASGPQRAEDGTWDGSGVCVLRATSLAEAREIAEKEPFHVAGFRRNEVRGWQVSEGSFSFTFGLLSGTSRMG